MAVYIINLTDGSKTFTVPENTVTTNDMPIGLIGHGFPSYGQPQNENFVHLLENFSSENEPRMAIKGQLWFKQNPDGQTYEIKVCKKAATRYDDETHTSDAEWDKLLKSSSSDGGVEPLNPSTGDIWYDVTNHQLKIYDSTVNDGEGAWVEVGPINMNHIENDYGSSNSTNSGHAGTYTISKDVFETDVENAGKPETSDKTGGIFLVTLKVLIKEVGIKDSGYIPDNLRSCAMIYRFVVRTINNDGTYDVSIMGSPNYEIIAKSDNLNFTTKLNISSGNIEFTIDNLSTVSNTYFVNGITMEVDKV